MKSRFPLVAKCSALFGVFVFLVNATSLFAQEGASILPVMAVDLPTISGTFYQVERSENMESWEPVGSSFKSAGGTLMEYVAVKDRDRFFYRARPIEGEWVNVWGDEFDGELIDRTKWANDINANGGGNNELQYYTDDSQNSFIENGNLVIQALDTPHSGLDGSKNYSSGKLHTKFRGSWKYGRVEARAKLPIGQGIWPAIWMLPMPNEYGGWASSGEIDIVELVGHEPSTVHGTIHYGAAWPNNSSTGTDYELDSGTFFDEFHVFAVEWEEGEIRWYVDGELFQTITSWYSENGTYPAPFDKPFYLLLNVAVGGNWPGNPNGSTPFPARMEVDYVRVYEWAE